MWQAVLPVTLKAANLLSCRADIAKLAGDDRIRFGALCLLLFAEDEATARHDLDALLHTCLDEDLPVSTPAVLVCGAEQATAPSDAASSSEIGIKRSMVFLLCLSGERKAAAVAVHTRQHAQHAPFLGTALDKRRAEVNEQIKNNEVEILNLENDY